MVILHYLVFLDTYWRAQDGVRIIGSSFVFGVGVAIDSWKMVLTDARDRQGRRVHLKSVGVVLHEPWELEGQRSLHWVWLYLLLLVIIKEVRIYWLIFHVLVKGLVLLFKNTLHLLNQCVLVLLVLMPLAVVKLLELVVLITFVLLQIKVIVNVVKGFLFNLGISQKILAGLLSVITLIPFNVWYIFQLVFSLIYKLLVLRLISLHLLLKLRVSHRSIRVIYKVHMASQI